MAVEIINKLKTFNTQTIRGELDAISGLPSITTKFSGFENAGQSRLDPFPESSRVISRTTQRDGTVVEDSADTGDIRFESRDPLSAGDVTAITAVLDAHDATVDTTDQAKARQQSVDIASLKALHDAGISDPTVALAVKVQLVELGEDV